VTVTGHDFGSLQQITISWSNPKIVLGTVMSDVHGTFAGSGALTFTVPTGSAAGSHKISAIGASASGYAEFTVQ